MRKKLIAANWKMYKTPEQARAFVSSFLPVVWEHTRDEIVLCAPFVCLAAVTEAISGSPITLGAQDVIWQNEGAFTGEVSAALLNAGGGRHAIIVTAETPPNA